MRLLESHVKAMKVGRAAPPPSSAAMTPRGLPAADPLAPSGAGDAAAPRVSESTAAADADASAASSVLGRGGGHADADVPPLPGGGPDDAAAGEEDGGSDGTVDADVDPDHE